MTAYGAIIRGGRSVDVERSWRGGSVRKLRCLLCHLFTLNDDVGSAVKILLVGNQMEKRKRKE
jgi:hypothetical protein